VNHKIVGRGRGRQPVANIGNYRFCREIGWRLLDVNYIDPHTRCGKPPDQVLPQETASSGYEHSFVHVISSRAARESFDASHPEVRLY
jgi:hypothetical protein